MATATPTTTSAAAPAHRRWSRWHLVAAAFVVPWLIVGIARTMSPVPHLGYDLELLGRAATRLLDGAPIYLDPSGASFYPGSLDLYYGPPSYLIPWLPFAHLPDVVLQRLAYPLGLLEVAIALVLLLWNDRERITSTQVAALTIGTLGCWVVYAGLSLGASSTLTLVLVALSWFYLRRGSDTAAGITLGTVIAWRVYPAALVLPLLIARRWRAAGWAIVSGLTWTGLGWLIAGNQASEYPALLFHLNGLEIPGTASPAAFAAFLGLAQPFVTAIHVVSIAAGLGLLLAGGRTMRSEEPGWRLVGWGIAAAGCLLLPGVIWDHYLTLLLVLAAGLVLATGWELPALLPLGVWSAVAGGGLALLWIPAVAGAIRWRATAPTPTAPTPTAPTGPEPTTTPPQRVDA